MGIFDRVGDVMYANAEFLAVVATVISFFSLGQYLSLYTFDTNT